MVLIDTSAWIEFLRRTESPGCAHVRSALVNGAFTCGPVQMEVLAGARSSSHLADLQAVLAAVTVIPTEPADFDSAAELYRRCRLAGETVRNLIDCLVAAIAIRTGIPVLHNDADYAALARHTELQVYTP